MVIGTYFYGRKAYLLVALLYEYLKVPLRVVLFPSTRKPCPGVLVVILMLSGGRSLIPRGPLILSSLV